MRCVLNGGGSSVWGSVLEARMTMMAVVDILNFCNNRLHLYYNELWSCPLPSLTPKLQTHASFCCAPP